MRLTKILIVDDDSRFTRLVKATLERTGHYEVSQDNDGLDTVNVAKEFGADLVLLDVHMPKSNGPFIAQSLRLEPGMENLPIVYITGVVPKDHSTAERELGGFPYLAKPVELIDLEACIQANLPERKRVVVQEQ
jgi:DNA-binding response OmpR family regulator